MALLSRVWGTMLDSVEASSHACQYFGLDSITYNDVVRGFLAAHDKRQERRKQLSFTGVSYRAGRAGLGTNWLWARD